MCLFLMKNHQISCYRDGGEKTHTKNKEAERAYQSPEY